jgi:hypothetical protein
MICISDQPNNEIGGCGSVIFQRPRTGFTGHASLAHLGVFWGFETIRELLQ